MSPQPVGGWGTGTLQHLQSDLDTLLSVVEFQRP